MKCDDERKNAVATQFMLLQGVRDGLFRDANNYEPQEHASQQVLSS